MKRFKLLLTFALVFSFSISWAQQENYNEKKTNTRKTTEESTFDYNSEKPDKKWDWANARIGGNFGLGFQSGGLYIDASPTFGYKINRIVELGAGFKTLYYRKKNYYRGETLSSLTYGPLAYGRFTVWDGIFAMAQYEMANKDRYYISNASELDDRINVHHLLIGAGYSTAIGNAGNLNISLLYDVIDDKESIYQFGTFGDFPLLLNVSFGFGINRR